MHPTGFPAYVILGWIANQVLAPFGSTAFRMNLLSGILAAGAGALSVLVYRRLGAPALLAGAIAVAFALAPITWHIGVSADVHSLHVFLVVLVTLLLLRWDAAVQDARGAPDDEQLARRADRRIVLAAAVFGVAVANHALSLLLVPGIGLFVLPRPGHPAPAQGRPRGARGIDRRRGAAVPPAPAARRAIPCATRLRTSRDADRPARDRDRAPVPGRHRGWRRGRARRCVRRPRAGPARTAAVRGPGRVRRDRDPAAALRGVLRPGGDHHGALRRDLRERPHRPLLPRPAVLRLVVGRGDRGRARRPAARDRGRRDGRRPSPASTCRGPRSSIVLGLALLVPTAVAIRDRWSEQNLSTNTLPSDWLDEAFDAMDPNALVLSWWSYSTPMWYGAS